ncbi:acyl-CoA dehydrogenase family protein [Streptomyces sp. NPDC048717]|uniref:acyl-CoA dehydrogenase family protein n=1 Tax=Streptomyces sp. NPDC048717 TaxID=3154928 RepID=UPI0034176B4D
MTGSAGTDSSLTPLANLAALPSEEFLAGVEEAAAHFDAASYPQRQMPAEDWAVLTGAGVLLPVLPAAYGGRNSHAEMCRVVEILAERNLAVAVYTAIVTGLALRPVVVWAGEETRREVLPLFAGPLAPTAGFASTEPAAGSAMSGLTTTFEEVEGGYRIRGRKHWQALSATASWWLVVARRDGEGGREYGWFVVERGDGFRTSQRYDAVGLKVIDYGVNDIDAFVPAHRRIDIGAGNLSSMVDVYLSGRALIGALAGGFLRRVAREAHTYADTRRVGRGPLSSIGFVRYRLDAIDGAHTVCAALGHHVRTRLDLTSDLTPAFPAVQAVKIAATELMVGAANHYQQLTGGEGYRSGSPTNIAAQAFLDSRVFTIFDGTNDLLSQQLAQYCLDRSDGDGLGTFLAAWEPTAPAVSAYGLDLRFLDGALAQEHLVLAGRVIAYAFAAARVLEWAAETGTDTDTARRAVAFLEADVERVRVEFGLLARLGADT